MTRTEIESLLGKPKDEGATYWYRYGPDDVLVTYNYDAPIPSQVAVCVRGTHLEKDGKVVLKVGDSPETIRALLGWPNYRGYGEDEGKGAARIGWRYDKAHLTVMFSNQTRYDHSSGEFRLEKKSWISPGLPL